MSLGNLGSISDQMQALYLKELSASKSRIEAEIKDLEEYAETYRQVIKQAEEYSKKLEAPILAKISEVGYFCDAHVVRTNQMTLELGANYFVECSLHSAKKILTHRIAELQKHQEEGREAIRMIEEKAAFCDTLKANSDEIVEEYDEEAEKVFYENRKKRRLQQKAAQSQETDSADKAHQDAMSRLAELELLEEENEELPGVSEVEAPKPFEVELEEVEPDVSERLLAKSGVSPKEMQALLDYLDACSDEESSEEEYSDEENGDNELDSDDYDIEKEIAEESPKKVVEVPKKKKSLRFAQQLENVKTFLQSDKVEEIKTKESSPIVETKSILRSKEPTPVDRSALEPVHKELEAMSTASFPGEIVEKNPYVCLPSTSKDPSPVITEAKVSKFRASRSRN